jgi:hypothetical protein
LKLLTAIRAGNKQKKIDIHIPKLDDFIHKTYIHVARKIYKNVYLFELAIPPLQAQKNNRELEIIIQECILNSIRESIPVEAILRAYMDESVEEDVIEEIKEQVVENPKVTAQKEIEAEIKKEISKSIETEKLHVEQLAVAGDPPVTSISFGTPDLIQGGSDFQVPKQFHTSSISSFQSDNDLDNDNDTLNSSLNPNIKLNITDQNIELDDLDIHVIPERNMELLPDLLIDNVEVLA